MFQVIKRQQVNGREVVKVLTESEEFTLERFIGDENSITGPHRAKEWKTRRGAQSNADRFPGAEVR